jgi:hypothetical protein
MMGGLPQQIHESFRLLVQLSYYLRMVICYEYREVHNMIGGESYT